jgi:hypothetical protein
VNLFSHDWNFSSKKAKSANEIPIRYITFYMARYQ